MEGIDDEAEVIVKLWMSENISAVLIEAMSNKEVLEKLELLI